MPSTPSQSLSADNAPTPVHDAGTIAARLDRLPATRTVWQLVALLALGYFFELYDLLYTGYVAPAWSKAASSPRPPSGCSA